MLICLNRSHFGEEPEFWIVFVNEDNEQVKETLFLGFKCTTLNCAHQVALLSDAPFQISLVQFQVDIYYFILQILKCFRYFRIRILKSNID